MDKIIFNCGGNLNRSRASKGLIRPIPCPYHFEANPEEVEEVISVLLDVLLDKRNLREEMQWVDGRFVPQYFYHYGNKVIWGAIARILKQFLEVIYTIGRAGM